MEEDAGKNTHMSSAGRSSRIHGAEYSLVDYNRAGIPLVEIVTRPITGAGERAPEVARAYVQTLRDIFRTLGVSEARMERGNVRADVNLSLRDTPGSPLGTRTETKNVNSFRSVDRAVRYEVSRQAAILAGGGTIVQETRHWHEDTGITTAGRVKSDAEDYRYFPEPDLCRWRRAASGSRRSARPCPSCPPRVVAGSPTSGGTPSPRCGTSLNAGALDLIEATVAAGATPAAARKWWMGELARTAKQQEVDLEELPVTPAQIGELQALVDSGRINDKLARQVLEGVLAGEGDAARRSLVARGLERRVRRRPAARGHRRGARRAAGHRGEDPRRQPPGRSARSSARS